ncbi:AAA family ATPase [Epibacterium sp. SM1969]|uniref:AAA family ATPase n=1 Tax=Tritonibacter aquimaris TaxID=2663379 RepID=A0A844AN07_9RHOB|nr:AAA family ATPase [Tritonibacter aquimaris]MQY43549.1 AAA family ATPase [Tritonibacter aquimaris]
MGKRFLITGCSGGGKSTLCDALSAAGFHIVAEPGRRIIKQEQETGGTAVPWTDMASFLLRVKEVSLQDLDATAARSQPVFYDRGLLDAAVAMAHGDGACPSAYLPTQFPYDAPVILAPPWREIYVSDCDRRHGFDEAMAEFRRIKSFLEKMALETITLPKTSTAERVRLIRRSLAL